MAIAAAATVGAVAVLAGFAWIFVFGDDPWPAWSDAAIMTVALIFAATAGIATARSIWHATRPNNAA